MVFHFTWHVECGSGASGPTLHRRKSSSKASMTSIHSTNLLDPVSVDWSAIDLVWAGTTKLKRKFKTLILKHQQQRNLVENWILKNKTRRTSLRLFWYKALMRTCWIVYFPYILLLIRIQVWWTRSRWIYGPVWFSFITAAAGQSQKGMLFYTIDPIWWMKLDTSSSASWWGQLILDASYDTLETFGSP